MQSLRDIIDSNDRRTSCCLPAIPFGFAAIDSALPSRGLDRGALHEFLYNDPLEPDAVALTIPTLLAYNALSSLRYILWIGKRSWPSPLALSGLGADNPTRSESLFRHSVFIDPPNDSAILWAIDLALRSPAVELVVATCPQILRTTTQRLTLAAKKYGTTAILLRSYSDYATPSCAASRWSIAPTPSTQRSPAWRLSLNKLRSGLLLRKAVGGSLGGEWIVSLFDALELPASKDSSHGQDLISTQRIHA
jgi:hypothetical protein